ncbi:MAG: hypothetical protein ABI478_03785 [Propionivibrio sp.]
MDVHSSDNGKAGSEAADDVENARLEPGDPQLPRDPPIPGQDHAGMLEGLIAEGHGAAMELFEEARKDEHSLEQGCALVGLATRVSDNVRKAIATHDRRD